MFKLLKRFRSDRRGATAIEYGLIAALVGTAIIAGATSLGTSLNTAFASIAKTVTDSNKAP